MKQFVIDVLNISIADKNVQRVVYYDNFEQFEGVHVGFVIFNETVRDSLEMLLQQRTKVINYGLKHFVFGENSDVARDVVFGQLRSQPIYGGGNDVCKCIILLAFMHSDTCKLQSSRGSNS